MPKVAVVFAPGCEEIEGLTVIDVLRRLGIDAKMVGLEDREVLGAHNIKLTCDELVGDQLLKYDLVAFPGGMGGSKRLRDNEQLKRLMVQRNREGKWDAAMCAAPIALARYGLLDNHDYTCYPGMNEEIQKEVPSARFHKDITVVDEEAKILTSRGPATALAYAFKIAEVLGVDTKQIKKDMLYDYLAQNI